MVKVNGEDCQAAGVSLTDWLQQAGYNPQALIDMLTEMKKNLAADTRGFGKTHPAPEDRIQQVRSVIGPNAVPPAPPARQERFDSMIGKVK